MKIIVFITLSLTVPIVVSQVVADDRQGGICSDQCFSRYNRSLSCQCTRRCPDFSNCCENYYEDCLPGTCEGRCGNKNSNLSCQCDYQCRKRNDCCQDFKGICTSENSCKLLCGLKRNRSRTCQCNSGCKDHGDCCRDYEKECEDLYTCNRGCNVTKGGCSCLDSCVKDNSCCTDYYHTCAGANSWQEEECTPSESMSCPSGFQKAPVILFSIDGFRNTYIYRNITPNLWKLASCGVHSSYMRPIYPTLTFPNHYTIATGLYPESHGVIANRFYDRFFLDEFRIGGSSTSDPKWWGGEPIWVTASNQGLKSASYFWVGSDVNITRYPDYYHRYDGSVPDEERVHQVLKWLDLPPKDRPSIILLYISKVDHAGHQSGPDGKKVNEAIREADKVVGMLMDGLKSRSLDRCANLIILSDHGMGNTSCDLVSYVDKQGIDVRERYFRGGASGRIGKSIKKSSLIDFNAAETLKKLQCKRNETHFQAYLKQQYLPKRFHYAYNNRIDDVILVLDDEWLVGGNTGSYSSCNGGTHGWDNQNIDMRAVFLAHGSSFKRGYNSSSPVDVIEIYNLLCELLDLEPASNNGTRGSLSHLLINPKPIPHESSYITPSRCSHADDDEVYAEKLGCPACKGEFQSRNLTGVAKEQGRMSGLSSGVTENYCILIHSDFVTVYNLGNRMPKYSHFVLERKNRDMKSIIPCVRPDPRVKVQYSPTCYDLDDGSNFTLAFLYHPALSGIYIKEATMLSNVIPVFSSFVPIWEQFATLLSDMSMKYNRISITVGPVFDYNYDGLADSAELLSRMGVFSRNGDNSSLPVPTHVFAVVTKCKDGHLGREVADCFSSPDDVEVLSFVIPNFNEDPCFKDSLPLKEWASTALYEHVARVKDIELLTGISFFPNWMSNTNASQSTIIGGLRLKLHLPEFGSKWLEDFLQNENPNPSPTEDDLKEKRLPLILLFSLVPFLAAIIINRRRN